MPKINFSSGLSILILLVLAFSQTACAKNRQVDQGEKQRILKQSPNLKPKVLNLSLKAYQCAINKDIDKKHILTIIDYSMPSNKKRMWVVDMNKDKTLFTTYVSHGKGSGNLYAKHFSNKNGSHATSIGLYKTGRTYYGHRGYSLKLRGLEKSFNDNAYRRHVVIHPAWYASPKMVKRYGRLGRSWGCPAINRKISKKVINTIKNDTLVFAYYPSSKWLSNSDYINCKG